MSIHIMIKPPVEGKVQNFKRTIDSEREILWQNNNTYDPRVITQLLAGLGSY